MRRPVLRALSALLLCLVGALPLEGQTNQPEIASLGFVGNQSFSDGALQRAIVTRQTECRTFLLQIIPFCPAGADWAHRRAFLDRRTLVRDMARIRLFYYQRGYREARVDTVLARPTEGRVALSFQIREGRPVRVDSLAITGLEEILGREILGEEVDSGVVRDLPLALGDPLSMLLMEATRDSLASRLQNRGFAHVDVFRNYFIPTHDPYVSGVTFEVFPGPPAVIGPMTVVGNEVVSDTVVRRMLPFREGDPYDREQIFDAQRNLFNLEIFRHAEIRADLEHLPDSVVPLQIQVNEGDAHRVTTGAGWNNADCLNTESSWTSRNFFGGARRLEVRGRLSNILAPNLNQTICDESGSGEFGELNWLLSADFNQPWFFSARNSFGTGLFVERQSLKDVFIRESVGASLSLSRSLARSTTLGLSYRPEVTRLDAAEIFFCTSFLVCDPADIDVLQSANLLSPLVLTFTRDRSNRVLNPSRGYTLFGELEHASGLTGSDFAYNRAVGEVNVYAEPLPGLVTAARLRAGWITPETFGALSGRVENADIVHPQKRFFAGGSNSVRGYAQNQLGPRVLSVPVDRLTSDTIPGSGGVPVCLPVEVASLGCDASPLGDGRFTSRPTGGSQLLEGNVELRFPLVGDRSQGAFFLDFGQVWPEADRVSLDDVRFTPGFGVRYLTPIGPLRLDVGYKLRSGERLRVVTSQIRPFDPDRDRENDRIDGPDGKLDWVPADQLALLDPTVLFEDDDPLDLGRFQIHISIGQAF